MLISSPALRGAFLLSLCAFVAACGGGGSSGDEVLRTGDLAVSIVDARQPTVGVEGAAVTVTAGISTKSATTPANGIVIFTGLRSGIATVTVAREPFRPYTADVTVQGGTAQGHTARLQRRAGQVVVSAKDAFGAPVVNAQAQVTVEGQNFVGTTNASGEVTLADVPTGSVPVGIVAAGFLPEPAHTVTVVESPAVTVDFELDRKTESAGGIVKVPPTVPPTPPTDSGQTLTFRIRAVVVNEQAQAVEDLEAAAFTLAACVDVDATRAECVRAPDAPSFDAAYTPVSATPPDSFLRVAGQAASPFAVALSFDQSGSIASSDPTDARVFASKTFLDGVGANDRVVLAALAAGADARIPTTPMTAYGTFTSDGRSYFDELDLFPTQEGGGTPLYQALDELLTYTAQNAPAVAGQRKAVALFTDGFDTVCADPVACREATINLSRTLGVDIITIGLADSVDSPTLIELSYRGNGAHLVAANPEQLVAIYGSLGKVLNGTITTYETGWTIRAGAAGVFVSGRSVLGTLRVSTGGKILELPFQYTIP